MPTLLNSATVTHLITNAVIINPIIFNFIYILFFILNKKLTVLIKKRTMAFTLFNWNLNYCKSDETKKNTIFSHVLSN